MRKKPEDYLKEPYSRVLLPEEDGRFSAEILEFTGCFAQGNSPNEAFENLEKTAKSWIQACLDQGLDIPSPALNQNYSGRIALRIPRSMHKKAAQFAERDSISLNQFLISALASRIGAEEYHSYLSEKIAACSIANTTIIINTQNNPVIVSNPTFLPQKAYNIGEISYVGSDQLCLQP